MPSDYFEKNFKKQKIVAPLASYRRFVARRQWDQAYDFVATVKKIVVSQSQLQWDRGLMDEYFYSDDFQSRTVANESFFISYHTRLLQ